MFFLKARKVQGVQDKKQEFWPPLPGPQLAAIGRSENDQPIAVD